MAVYNTTGDPYYLNAARIIVDRCLERQRADGSWRRHMVPGHCHCEPRHHGNAGFMVAVLLNGFKLYHQATHFTAAQLEAVHRHLLDTDVAIKSGQLEAEVALDLLVAGLAATGD